MHDSCVGCREDDCLCWDCVHKKECGVSWCEASATYKEGPVTECEQYSNFDENEKESECSKVEVKKEIKFILPRGLCMFESTLESLLANFVRFDIHRDNEVITIDYYVYEKEDNNG